MRKHVMEKNVHIWKLLRSPFTLPTLTCKTHICDWEIIDLDVYGVYTPRGREATRCVAADAMRCGVTACGRGGTVTLGTPRGTWHGG